MRHFAEHDSQRLVRRISAISAGDLTNREIGQLVEGDLGIMRRLPTDSQQGIASLMTAPARGQLEKMVGPSLDFVPVSYLRLARRAADAVARVVSPERRAIGTGVMVTPRLFLTNNHVLPDPDGAGTNLLQFDHELGDGGDPLTATEFALEPSAFFWTSPEDDLDATLVAVGRMVTGTRPLDSFGWCALSSAGDKHAEGDHVSVIQHPDGDFKQIALRDNRVIGRGAGEITLHYGADTLPGSSGSPVFNDQFSLVALHHAGGPRNETTLETGEPVPADSNEGIRISAIVKALRERHDELPPAIRTFLAEALNPPGPTPLEDARVIGHGPPSTTGLSGPTAVLTQPLTTDLQLPIRLAIHDTTALPGTSTREAGTAVQGTGLAERNDAPDPDYLDRPGVDTHFLSVELPLPGVPQSMLATCAKLVAGTGDDVAAYVLPYHHFSVIVRADRRMPLFTVVNIDGRKARSINRETGEIEASETWFADPRIDADAQLSQEFFANQRPRLFDRGHLVRRLDPAWGSPVTAKRGADDTFHFTNCCPQISAFNQRLWLSIEDYALANATAEKERITVITGPIFGSNDPDFRDVAIPHAFWKIVARVDQEGLRATGFVADHGVTLDAALSSEGVVEGFDDLAKVSLHQRGVAEIENMTRLDFGPLREHDTAPELEAALEPLATLSDAAWT